MLRRAKQFLTHRARAYRRLFNITNQDAEFVLADLAKFCRAHSSTAHKDPYIAARLDGRREVWLRLQQHLQLDDDTLWALIGGPQPSKGE